MSDVSVRAIFVTRRAKANELEEKKRAEAEAKIELERKERLAARRDVELELTSKKAYKGIDERVDKQMALEAEMAAERAAERAARRARGELSDDDEDGDAGVKVSSKRYDADDAELDVADDDKSEKSEGGAGDDDAEALLNELKKEVSQNDLSCLHLPETRRRLTGFGRRRRGGRRREQEQRGGRGSRVVGARNRATTVRVCVAVWHVLNRHVVYRL